MSRNVFRPRQQLPGIANMIAPAIWVVFAGALLGLEMWQFFAVLSRKVGRQSHRRSFGVNDFRAPYDAFHRSRIHHASLSGPVEPVCGGSERFPSMVDARINPDSGRGWTGRPALNARSFYGHLCVGYMEHYCGEHCLALVYTPGSSISSRDEESQPEIGRSSNTNIDLFHH
jgi:hypothetical protein